MAFSSFSWAPGGFWIDAGSGSLKEVRTGVGFNGDGRRVNRIAIFFLFSSFCQTFGFKMVHVVLGARHSVPPVAAQEADSLVVESRDKNLPLHHPPEQKPSASP